MLFILADPAYPYCLSLYVANNVTQNILSIYAVNKMSARAS